MNCKKCHNYKKTLKVCASGFSPKDIRKCECMTTTELKEVYKLYLKAKHIQEVIYTKEIILDEQEQKTKHTCCI